MKSLKIFVLLVMTFDLGTGNEVEFNITADGSRKEDMICSFDGSSENKLIKKISIVALLGSFEETLAVLEENSEKVDTGNATAIKATGNISGMKGFLRLIMKENLDVLKYVCRVLVKDSNHNVETMESSKENKRNRMMIIMKHLLEDRMKNTEDENEKRVKDALIRNTEKSEEKILELMKQLVEQTEEDIKERVEQEVKQTEEKIKGEVKQTEEKIKERIEQEVKQSEEKIKGEVKQTEEKIKERVEQEVKQSEEKIKGEVKQTEEKIKERVEQEVKQTEEKIKGEVKQTEENLSKKLDKLFVPRSCKDFRTTSVVITSSRMTITNKYGVKLFCDTETDGGGWTVFQRRINGDVDFYRNWTEYESGFGSHDSSFWMGLKMLNYLTAEGKWELRVDLKYKGKDYYAKYSHFKIGDESTNYKLSVSGYSGNAGDSLDYHNNVSFSTYDRDHDKFSGDCAVSNKGAWWYGSCSWSNLNGKWTTSVHWYTIDRSYHSVSFTEMKIRRIG